MLINKQVHFVLQKKVKFLFSDFLPVPELMQKSRVITAKAVFGRGDRMGLLCPCLSFRNYKKSTTSPRIDRQKTKKKTTFSAGSNPIGLLSVYGGNACLRFRHKAEPKQQYCGLPLHECRTRICALSRRQSTSNWQLNSWLFVQKPISKNRQPFSFASHFPQRFAGTKIPARGYEKGKRGRWSSSAEKPPTASLLEDRGASPLMKTSGAARPLQGFSFRFTDHSPLRTSRNQNQPQLSGRRNGKLTVKRNSASKNNVSYNSFFAGTNKTHEKMSELQLITIEIASAEKIRHWAEKTLPNGKIIGQVLNANTLHHRTFKPQKGGLFCERIFGPLKDFECACGKIKKAPLIRAPLSSQAKLHPERGGRSFRKLPDPPLLSSTEEGLGFRQERRPFFNSSPLDTRVTEPSSSLGTRRMNGTGPEDAPPLMKEASFSAQDQRMSNVFGSNGLNKQEMSDQLSNNLFSSFIKEQRLLNRNAAKLRAIESESMNIDFLRNELKAANPNLNSELFSSEFYSVLSKLSSKMNLSYFKNSVNKRSSFFKNFPRKKRTNNVVVSNKLSNNNFNQKENQDFKSPYTSHDLPLGSITQPLGGFVANSFLPEQKANTADPVPRHIGSIFGGFSSANNGNEGKHPLPDPLLLPGSQKKGEKDRPLSLHDLVLEKENKSFNNRGVVNNILKKNKLDFFKMDPLIISFSELKTAGLIFSIRKKPLKSRLLPGQSAGLYQGDMRIKLKNSVASWWAALPKTNSWVKVLPAWDRTVGAAASSGTKTQNFSENILTQTSQNSNRGLSMTALSTIKKSDLSSEFTSVQHVHSASLPPPPGGVRDSEQEPEKKRLYCNVCDVEYTWSVIRRYQLGYIALIAPVAHVWYIKTRPNLLSIVLGIKAAQLENIVYCTKTLTLENTFFQEKNPLFVINNTNSLSPKFESMKKEQFSNSTLEITELNDSSNLSPAFIPAEKYTFIDKIRRAVLKQASKFVPVFVPKGKSQENFLGFNKLMDKPIPEARPSKTVGFEQSTLIADIKKPQLSGSGLKIVQILYLWSFWQLYEFDQADIASLCKSLSGSRILLPARPASGPTFKRRRRASLLGFSQAVSSPLFYGGLPQNNVAPLPPGGAAFLKKESPVFILAKEDTWRGSLSITRNEKKPQETPPGQDDGCYANSLTKKSVILKLPPIVLGYWQRRGFAKLLQASTLTLETQDLSVLAGSVLIEGSDNGLLATPSPNPPAFSQNKKGLPFGTKTGTADEDGIPTKNTALTPDTGRLNGTKENTRPSTNDSTSSSKTMKLTLDELKGTIKKCHLKRLSSSKLDYNKYKNQLITFSRVTALLQTFLGTLRILFSCGAYPRFRSRNPVLESMNNSEPAMRPQFLGSGDAGTKNGAGLRQAFQNSKIDKATTIPTSAKLEAVLRCSKRPQILCKPIKHFWNNVHLQSPQPDWEGSNPSKILPNHRQGSKNIYCLCFNFTWDNDLEWQNFTYYFFAPVDFDDRIFKQRQYKTINQRKRKFNQDSSFIKYPFVRSSLVESILSITHTPFRRHLSFIEKKANNLNIAFNNYNGLNSWDSVIPSSSAVSFLKKQPFFKEEGELGMNTFVPSFTPYRGLVEDKGVPSLSVTGNNKKGLSDQTDKNNQHFLLSTFNGLKNKSPDLTVPSGFQSTGKEPALLITRLQGRLLPELAELAYYADAFLFVPAKKELAVSSSAVPFSQNKKHPPLLSKTGEDQVNAGKKINQGIFFNDSIFFGGLCLNNKKRNNQALEILSLALLSESTVSLVESRSKQKIEKLLLIQKKYFINSESQVLRRLKFWTAGIQDSTKLDRFFQNKTRVKQLPTKSKFENKMTFILSSNLFNSTIKNKKPSQPKKFDFLVLQPMDAVFAPRKPAHYGSDSMFARRGLSSTAEALRDKKGIEEPGSFNTPLTGAALLKFLLMEYNYSELQKMDRQYRILLNELQQDLEQVDNKKTLKLKIGKKEKLFRRIKVIRKLKQGKDTIERIILSVLPVLPPDLRPIVTLNSQIAASDLNRLYQKVLYRNERLKKFLKDAATRNSYEMKYAQRLLQESVDNLIENGKSGVVPERDARGRLFKSLTELLKGKQGRFRQYLLGKRVDYSGRSVIVVGPKLKLHECGLPIEMAVELFLPFLIKRILTTKLANNVYGAKQLIKKDRGLTCELLQEVMHPVLLNRAPTLHRLGIQAFQPKLVTGRAILLHPLVCPSFNADFDGDQMAVHVPITPEARTEAWKLMLSRNNILSPASGDPLILPSQDMVLGCYYLTTLNFKYQKGSGLFFNSFNEVIKAYERKLVDVHSNIWVLGSATQRRQSSVGNFKSHIPFVAKTEKAFRKMPAHSGLLVGIESSVNTFGVTRNGLPPKQSLPVEEDNTLRLEPKKPIVIYNELETNALVFKKRKKTKADIFNRDFRLNVLIKQASKSARGFGLHQSLSKTSYSGAEAALLPPPEGGAAFCSGKKEPAAFSNTQTLIETIDSKNKTTFNTTPQFLPYPPEAKKKYLNSDKLRWGEIRIMKFGFWLQISPFFQKRYDPTGFSISEYIRTTPGRVLLNQLIKEIIEA